MTVCNWFGRRKAGETPEPEPAQVGEPEPDEDEGYTLLNRRAKRIYKLAAVLFVSITAVDMLLPEIHRASPTTESYLSHIAIPAIALPTGLAMGALRARHFEEEDPIRMCTIITACNIPVAWLETSVIASIAMARLGEKYDTGMVFAYAAIGAAVSGIAGTAAELWVRK